MASSSEVKLGGVFVEIGTRMGKLSAGLDKAMGACTRWAANVNKNMLGGVVSGVRGFGSMVEDLGKKLAAGGAASLAPLILAGKTVADYGENIGKLATKTGLTTQMLSGLAYQAESAGIGIGAIGSAMRSMQRNIVNGSKESAEALKSLGVNADKLRTLSPDEQFLTLSDALANVADSGQRSALAMAVFGRAGVEILPIIEGGRAEMERARREADALGLVLAGKAAEGANNLDSALDRLGGASKGLQLQLGAALAPVLTDVVNRLLSVVTAATAWIKTHPEAVVGFAKMGAAVFALGAGMIVLGAAIQAVLSPILISTVLIGGMGAALLAVLDIVGMTQTGFGELFNSIRIDGTGLGTWFATFGTFVASVWLHIEQMARDAWGGVKLVGELAFRALYQAGLMTARLLITPFELLFSVITTGLNQIVAVYNAVAKKIGATPMEFKIGNPLTGAKDKLDQEMDANKNAAVNAITSGVDGSEARSREYDARRGFLEKERQRLFAKDPQDGKGTRIDTSRAAEALKTIGGNVIGALDGAFDALTSKLNIQPLEFEEPPEKGAQTSVPLGADGKTDFSSVGTFSGIATGLIAGSGVFSQQLQIQQQMAASLKSLDQKVSGEGGVVLG